MIEVMCGRFVLCTTSETLLDAASDLLGRNVPAPHGTPPAREDIRPTQMIATVGEQLLPARWGVTARSVLFNARAETISEKPSFAWAYRHCRVLIPMDGYYEWRGPAYLVHGTGLLWAAGLFRAGETTIITTAAPSKLSWLHSRTPLLLTDEQANIWLYGEPAEVLHPTEVSLSTELANPDIFRPQDQQMRLW